MLAVVGVVAPALQPPSNPAPTQQSQLGGNVGIANAFVDLTKDVNQINQIVGGVIQWSNPAPPLSDANGNLLADFNLTIYENLTPGIYNASFSGAPQTTITGLATGTNAAGKMITQNINVLNQVTSGGVTTVQLAIPTLPGGINGGAPSGIQLAFTHTGGTLENLHIIRPGYSITNPPLFTNAFLASYQNLGPTSLRFMDASDTNGNVSVNWSDRTLPTDAFPRKNSVTETVPTVQPSPAGAQINPVGSATVTSVAGLPWEYDVALANALHADMWINIPVDATDSYVRQLANLIKNGDTVGGVSYAGLAAGLHVYVEYGNENWNYGFPQASNNLANAILAVTGQPNPVTGAVIAGSNLDYDGSQSDEYQWAGRQAAQRTVQLVQDFAAVYGAGAINNQVRGVLASNGGTSQEDSLKYLNQFFGSPNNYLYGLAMNPYFTLTSAQAANPNLTSGQILTDLQADLNNLTPNIQSFVTEAHAWGLAPLAYEGGPSLGDPSGGPSTLNLSAVAAAEMSPQYANIVQAELNVWFANGGGQFNFFELGVSQYPFGNQYGDWAVTDNQTNLNEPKEVAFRAVRFSPPVALVSGSFTGFSPLPGELDARQSAPLYGSYSATVSGYAQPAIVYQGYAASASPHRDYSILSPTAASYLLELNVVASATLAPVTVYLNGNLVGTVKTPIGTAGTGNTVPLPLNLQAGFNTIRIVTTAGLNSLDFLNPSGAPLAQTAPFLGLNVGQGPVAIAKNGSKSIGFTVSSGGNLAAAFTITAVSDNPALVPNRNLTVVAGAFLGGQNRQLTIKPLAGASGTANITLTLTSAGGVSRTVIIPITVS